MDYLEKYYVAYDEEGRLLSRHGQVEYITTMKYIHENAGMAPDYRILEVGAGTGRYSAALAEEGYLVDAVELTAHNLEIMKAKVCEMDNIRTWQGTATDLSRFADDSFDMTLLLGPMYHLYTEQDKKLALREALRVTKAGGFLYVAYILNDFVIVTCAFGNGTMKEQLEKGMIRDNFRYADLEEQLFVFETPDSINELEKDLDADRVKILAADGVANYFREKVDAFDDETFALWMRYHLQNCERADLLGATNHCLDILRKRKKGD